MLAAAISLGGILAANAQEFTKGTVKKVMADQQKVTIIHEELTNLDMPAMTMVFNVADPAMLARLQAGADIEFVAERVRGKSTPARARACSSRAARAGARPPERSDVKHGRPAALTFGGSSPLLPAMRGWQAELACDVFRVGV